MWCPFSLKEKEVALFNLVPNRLVPPNKTKRKKEVGLEIQFQEKLKKSVTCVRKGRNLQYATIRLGLKKKKIK